MKILKSPILKFSSQFQARCALATVCGLIYALSFPPFGLRWIVIPALLGLLLALKEQSGTRARLLGFLFGFVAFALSLSWLWNIFDAMALALWAVLAVFTTAFAHFQGRAHLRGISGWKFAVFTAINWCAWEFVRAEVFPLKLPWMTTGLAIGPNLLLPWIGVYCTSLFVVLAAVLLSQGKWKSAAFPVAVVALAVFFSKKHAAPNPGDSRTVKVAGIQLEGVSLNEYLAATKDLPEDVQHVIWPEYSVPFDIRENERDWNILLNLCRDKNITLTFGTQSRPGGGDKWRNIALTMDPTGYLGEHTKIHTVHFFDDGTPGEIAGVVKTDLGMIGTPICFDCDYEDIVRTMVASGADFIVVPTMDAESWSVRQHDQHAELARIRAAENGRWVFVTATSGVSQLIDPAGHLHARLGAMEKGTVSGILRRESRMTFFTRLGWLAPWIVLTSAVVAWLALLVPQRKIVKT